MKQLDIETLFQKPGSQDCGPVCVQMVLTYLNQPKKLKEITETMNYVSSGTYIYDCGSFLQQNGLTTKLITANPYLFKKEDIAALKNDEDIDKHLSKLKKLHPKREQGITLFQNYLASQGSVEIAIPSMRHIKENLKRGNPVIALLYGGVLGKNEGGFHFVVVSGYKKGFVYINNPLKKSRQGWFPEEDFLYAIHSSTMFDIDNGSFLVVKKK